MRNFPIGTEISDEGVHFRVWASGKKRVEVVLKNKGEYALKEEKNGYFSALIPEAQAGDLYGFRLDGTAECYPDPASRFQPEGPFGLSQIIDTRAFSWSDGDWKGLKSPSKAIIYELHIGTFTLEGTWRSAMGKLPYLADLGITVIEMMPIAAFGGRFNWGYDGVNLFAPTQNYGQPNDLRSFINEAHRLGIAVILDVVYNHFGPEGNYLPQFSPYYLKKDLTEWGQSINFDSENNAEVRSFFIANAAYWIEEFHFDGLRFDACHAIRDFSKRHVLADIAQECRKRAGDRKLYLTAENEQEAIQLALPEEKGGYGLDAVWNEDFHHAAFVRLTGRNEAYFADYLGKAQEFVSAIKYGFLYQGQWYSWQKKHRGTPCLDIPHHVFIHFLNNHDQVANTPGSMPVRHFSQPGSYRAISTLLLLGLETPLLFQGQEYGSTRPFLYFSDQEDPLAENVYRGRVEFMTQFRSFNSIGEKQPIPLHHDEETFSASKLDWKEIERDNTIYCLYKDLLNKRTRDPFFSQLERVEVDGAVLNDSAFVLRYTLSEDVRLLLFNFGPDLFFSPAPEPLCAPPKNTIWEMEWTTEKPAYGGVGNPPLPQEGNWWIPGHAALILKPR